MVAAITELVSSVTIVSVVWFTSTSWRRKPSFRAYTVKAKPERPRWTPRLAIYAVASERSSNSVYASRTSSRMRSWAALSAIGRSKAKLRRSPLMEY